MFPSTMPLVSGRQKPANNTMEFHRIWVKYCQATRTIRRNFGVKSALDYLIGEKLPIFAYAPSRDPNFAAELPPFLAAVWKIFNHHALTTYLKTLELARRKKLRQLLHV